MIRSLAIHLGVLVIASAVAARAWLSEDKPTEKTSVEIWSGTPDSVQQIEYTSKKRRVVLSANKDEQGRYFVADVERQSDPNDESDEPHGAEPGGSEPHGANPHADAPDAPSQGGAGNASAKPAAEPVMKTERFIAVSDALKLTERVAPLRGMRSLGKLDPARHAEFGFDAAEPARLKVQVGGNLRELVFGGKTPGGQDIYARDPRDEQTYVVDGQIARDLESAESRLLERTLHAWEDDEAVKVKVSVGEQSRELGRSAEKKSFWADPQKLEEKDETATNWMTKLERLRIVEYFEKLESPPEPLFSVEYYSEKGKLLGRIDVAKRPPASSEPDAKPEYLAKTEHTRWWGEVIQSTAEQLAQDATSVVQR